MKKAKRMLRQKPLSKMTIKPALRHVVLYGSFAIMLLMAGWFVYFNQPKQTYGAVTGDFRSKATGNWSSNSSWEKFNGTSWVGGSYTPTSADGAIEILPGHTVTITATITADQITVDSGATLIITASRYLYTNNGTGTDLIINGNLIINNSGYLTENTSSTIEVNGTLTMASGSVDQIGTSATLTINSGGRVINSGASIPTT